MTAHSPLLKATLVAARQRVCAPYGATSDHAVTATRQLRQAGKHETKRKPGDGDGVVSDRAMDWLAVERK